MLKPLTGLNLEHDAEAFPNRNLTDSATPDLKMEKRDEMDLLLDNQMVPQEPEIF